MEKEREDLGLPLFFLLFSFPTSALVMSAVCMLGIHELWALCCAAQSWEPGKLKSFYLC